MSCGRCRESGWHTKLTPGPGVDLVHSVRMGEAIRDRPEHLSLWGHFPGVLTLMPPDCYEE